MTAKEVQGKWELVVSNVLDVYKDARAARGDEANREYISYLKSICGKCAAFIAEIEGIS